jgi:Viral BACON domain
LPSGVTASFTPASATTTSSLTLNASSTATTGTSTVTITGTSGTLSHTTTVSLTVTVPANFSLSASPSSLTVAQGSNGSSTIIVAALGGFNGTVSFSASGLPSGVTATFNPVSTTSTSSLTLTVGATAMIGTSTVTITGTSGSLNHTATVSLTTPSTLTATPTALSFTYQIGSPTPAPQTISLAASPATLSFTAAPSGGTWLSAAPTSGTTPGTVSVSVNPSGLTAGTYSGTVTITSTGAAGSPQTVPITLTVSSIYTRQLNTTPSSSYPDFLIDAKGNYDVVWTDTTAGVFFSRSSDQGNSFPSSVVIPGSAGAALQPQFVVDSSGNNVDVVWAQPSSVAGSYSVLLSRSTDGGQHFAATPTPLTAAALPLADAPRIALEPSGGVDVVWGQNETWAIHSANGVTFPTPAVQLSTAAQDSGGPRIAVDSKGTIYVAWTDEVNKLATGSYCLQTGTNNTTNFTNTLGGNFYFNTTASGSGFNAANTRNLSNTDWAGVQPRWQFGFFGCSYDNLTLLVDSQDNLHMVWSDDTPDEDVLVSAYPVTDSAGKTRISFPTNLAPSAAASPHAIVANNGSGIPTLHVVWSDGPSDLTTQATPGIFYTHSTDTSAPFGQTFAGTPIRVASAKSEFPQVGVDSSGNVDVAWQQGDALIPSAFDVVLAPSFDGGNTFSLSLPVSINPSTDCLGPNTTDTTLIPPPPYSACGSVQLRVDSGNASNLVWVDSGSNVLFARQVVPPPAGFTMTLNTPSQTVSAGTATYTLTLTSANGFNQPVTITCPNGLPTGAACSATQVFPTASGTSATVIVLTVGSIPAGSFPFTITGAAGTTTHSVQATLVVNGTNAPDFSVNLPSSFMTSLQGQTSSYTVNIGSTAGFNNPVSVTCAGLPAGATCASSPASVTPPGSASVTIAVPGTLATGTYSFTITGTSGNSNHSQSAALAVGTLNAAVGPSTSATVAVGSSTNFTISLSSTNGSAGLVSLSCGALASGLNCTFAPTQVYVSPAGAASTNLTITVSAKPVSSSIYGSPNAWPNPPTWGIALSALLLITLPAMVAYRRNRTLSACVIRGLAFLVLVVVLGAGLISCGGTTGAGSSTNSIGNSVTTHFMLQGQSGTATMNLQMMSITVP